MCWGREEDKKVVMCYFEAWATYRNGDGKLYVIFCSLSISVVIYIYGVPVIIITYEK